jgi:hypothetical protein
MNKITKEQLTKLKGEFASKFGYEMDSWSTMVMFQISEGFSHLSTMVDKSIGQLDEAAKGIKGKVHQINFRTDQEAFKFGLGISAPVASTCGLIAVLIFWYKSTTEDYRQLKRIAEAYENVRSYQILMQNGEIVQREGQYFLTLTLANKGAGDMLIGQEYVFDGRTKRILIPLGRK